MSYAPQTNFLTKFVSFGIFRLIKKRFRKRSINIFHSLSRKYFTIFTLVKNIIKKKLPHKVGTSPWLKHLSSTTLCFEFCSQQTTFIQPEKPTRKRKSLLNFPNRWITGIYTLSNKQSTECSSRLIFEKNLTFLVSSLFGRYLSKTKTILKYVS